MLLRVYPMGLRVFSANFGKLLSCLAFGRHFKETRRGQLMEDEENNRSEAFLGGRSSGRGTQFPGPLPFHTVCPTKADLARFSLSCLASSRVPLLFRPDKDL